tara:strand:- start:1205 stop:2182 length:978 start_codon:yes stop_codon:yes gene_type:complete
MSNPVVLNVPEWDTSALRYMQPKISDRGAKTINMISTQSNRALHLSVPLMMTWGISDYVNEQGESDGKFSMTLNFPNAEYTSDATDTFLQKLKDFENQILDDAVKYSDAWFGEELSREVVKHNFFPFLKYSKDKLTKKIDASKPPSLRARVPCYNGKWDIEIYDTKADRIFPCDNDSLTPMDFVPKLSNVACVIQCGGLWFGGKGWGITWRVKQIVVKPREVVSIFGKCHVNLSTEDIETMESAPTVSEIESDKNDNNTLQVEDSDEEEVEEEVVESAPEPEPVKKKKTVKKTVKEEEVAVAVPEDVEIQVPKKKTVKKKAVAAA